MSHDLLAACRSLKQRPGLALAVAVPLAVAIGAILSVYALVHLFLAGPLGLPDGDRLLHLSQELPRLGGPVPLSAASYLTLVEQQEAAADSPLAGLAAYQVDRRTLTGRGEPVRIGVASVTPSFFTLARPTPLHGRGLLPEDAHLSEPRGAILGGGGTAVLSRGLWQRRFGADPDVVGTRIVLDGRSYEVVGVMSSEFSFPADTEVWIPLGFGDVAPLDFGGFYLQGLVRLAPGASEGAAAELLAPAAVRLRSAVPQITEDMRFLTVPLREHLYGEYRVPALLLLALTFLIVLGVSASGAQLLWARAISRQGDFALRMAMGASRSGLGRLLLLEGGILAVAGAAGGVALAQAILALFGAAVPLDVAAPPSIGGPVLVMSLAVALSGSLILGLVPVLAIDPEALNRYLVEGSLRSSEGLRPFRVRRILIAVQLALAVVLVANGLLILDSFSRLRSVPLGFVPSGVATVDLEMPPDRYDPAALRSFADRVVERLSGLPGAETSAVALRLPVLDAGGGIWFDLPARRDRAPATAIPATFNPVSPGFFRLLAAHPTAGREFTSADRDGGEPVALIDEGLARRYFADRSPIGETLVLTPWPDVRRRIVGVVPSLRYGGLAEEPPIAVYVPFDQLPFGQLRLLVRHDPSVAITPRALKEALWSVDSQLAPVVVGPLAGRLEGLVGPQRWAVRLVVALGALGLLLSVAAVYGAASQMVSHRYRELGIRSALGCTPRGIMRYVVLGRLPDVAVGLLLGLAALGIAGRWSRSVLYGTSPYDPVPLTLSLFLLVGTVLAALYLPARRAAAVDPSTLLR